MKRTTTAPRVSGLPVGTLKTWLSAAALCGLLGLHANLAHASCAAPANPIEAENCLPGSDPSVWRVQGSGDATIQGFARQMSVNAGQTVSFKINTAASSYTIAIFRLGYYGGLGARQIAT
ncbi:MAG: hypothetical protein KGL45_03550, partial [Gammaproteobacteria bacterium]|nr:hypothetical protein [Gammaproteobacteria bacterium]